MQQQRNWFEQLSQEKRVKMYGYFREWLSYREIWRRMGVAHTTISREIKRNSDDLWWDKMKYDPLKADKKRIQRRRKANRLQIKLWKDDKMRKRFEELLFLKWNIRWPDEILWRLRLEWYQTINTSTVYRFINKEKPAWKRFLRYKQLWYKTYGKGNKRKQWYLDVPNIWKRDEIINNRERIWDWEWDTIISNHKVKWGAVTLVERKSQYVLIKKTNNLKPATIKWIIEEMIASEQVITITFDNWIEFWKIWELWVQCFRANIYASHERWTNEKVNWFIRRFIPKWANIDERSDQEIQIIQDNLNHKPRKKLNYKTPFEVYNNLSLTYIS